jgi:hypothetical protein
MTRYFLSKSPSLVRPSRRLLNRILFSMKNNIFDHFCYMRRGVCAGPDVQVLVVLAGIQHLAYPLCLGHWDENRLEQSDRKPSTTRVALPVVVVLVVE